MLAKLFFLYKYVHRCFITWNWNWGLKTLNTLKKVTSCPRCLFLVLILLQSSVIRIYGIRSIPKKWLRIRNTGKNIWSSFSTPQYARVGFFHNFVLFLNVPRISSTVRYLMFLAYFYCPQCCYIIRDVCPGSRPEFFHSVSLIRVKKAPDPESSKLLRSTFFV